MGCSPGSGGRTFRSLGSTLFSPVCRRRSRPARSLHFSTIATSKDRARPCRAATRRAMPTRRASWTTAARTKCSRTFPWIESSSSAPRRMASKRPLSGSTTTGCSSTRRRPMPDHPPIEITPPDLSSYKAGNTGVEYVHVLESGKPGPSVMVQALTHGNEFCGAIALDYLLKERIRPAQGKLTLAFANVTAFARFDFDNPNRSRFVDEDYNRVWADEVLDGPRDSTELRRARELRRFVDAADYLLDLHSMHGPCRPIIACAKSDKSVALSRRVCVR